jgi:hypothetical protein
MSELPDRAKNRKPFNAARAEMYKSRIVQDMKRRAALPKDHPDYASPDSEVDDNNISRDASGKETDITGKKPKNKGR